MTKVELLERVYRTKGLPPRITKKTVARVVDAVFAELGNYFVKNKVTRSAQPKFTYPGFGTFTKRKRGERSGRNLHTGEPLTIPGSVTVGFVPGIDLKQLMNRQK
ncbi:MAG: HU family DNA-binding protein [Myxococcales bacterium]|nr:HU family DNA-binding protein [Myxococcales bacterium]